MSYTCKAFNNCLHALNNQYFKMENAWKFYITRLAQHLRRVNLNIDLQSFINIGVAIFKFFANKQ